MRDDRGQAPRAGRPAYIPPIPPSPSSPSGKLAANRSQPRWRRGDDALEAGPPSLPPQRASAPDWPLERDKRQRPAAAPAPLPPRRGDGPLIAIYIGEDNQDYTLRDLADGEEISVPKRRAAPEQFPPAAQKRASGAGLQRASGYAVLGALLGGAPGLALGVVTAVIALVRLARFEARARDWRKKQHQRLPASATGERLRLMTALWQSLGAVALGGVALLLLLTALF
jgi:hypothetical protein